jgi:hypothetical protein
MELRCVYCGKTTRRHQVCADHRKLIRHDPVLRHDPRFPREYTPIPSTANIHRRNGSTKHVA